MSSSRQSSSSGPRSRASRWWARTGCWPGSPRRCFSSGRPNDCWRKSNILPYSGNHPSAEQIHRPMSGAEFTVSAAPEVLPYLGEVADNMAALYGIDREEAVAIINLIFDRARALADKYNAEAAAGLGTPGARSVREGREHGVEIGINLESESGIRALMNRTPDYWAIFSMRIEDSASKLKADRALRVPKTSSAQFRRHVRTHRGCRRGVGVLVCPHRSNSCGASGCR